MKEYALYKGEELLSIGTIDEISEELGIKASTIYFYKSPAYTRRTSETNGRRLVNLDEEDD